MDVMSATELRRRLYEVLGEVAATGAPTTFTHKGRTFRLSAVSRERFLDRLIRREVFRVDPDEIVGPPDNVPEWREERYLDALS